MIVHAESRMLWRCWKHLRNMHRSRLEFRYSLETGYWHIGNYPWASLLEAALDKFNELENRERRNDLR